MADINVRHLIPVINGYVQIPDGQILYPTTVTPEAVLAAIAGSKLIRMGPAGTDELSPATYSEKDGDAQHIPHFALYIELPAFNAPGGQGTDYYAALRTMAAYWAP